MKSFAVAALAAGAAASYHPGYGYGGDYEAPSNGTAWVTKVLTKYEQYCPGPTTFSHGGVTYTATEATTITVTNCPCTVSYPATPTTYSSCVTCTPTPYSSPAAPVYSSSAAPEETTPASPVAPGSTYAPTYSVPSNATLPAGTAAPSVAPTKSTPESSPIASFTGAANKAFAASGASLAAIFGLVAYAL